jgi:hypothetical protein
MDLSKLQNTTSLLYDVKGVLGDNVDGIIVLSTYLINKELKVKC